MAPRLTFNGRMAAPSNHASTTPQLGRYTINTASSTIAFKTRHMFGLGWVSGTFAISTGTIDIAEPLAESTVQVEVTTASFDSGSEQRDSAVRSARFLDVNRHPTITFVADRVETSSVTGTLTVCGVAKPVTLSVEQSSVAPGTFSVRATTRIDRTEFGVTAARGMAGRHLDMTLEITCVRS